LTVVYDCSPTPVTTGINQYTSQICPLMVTPNSAIVSSTFILSVDVGSDAYITGSGIITWTAGQQHQQTLFVTAPTTTINFALTFNRSGTDMYHFPTPTQISITTILRHSIDVTGIMNGMLIYTSQPTTITITPSETPNDVS